MTRARLRLAALALGLLVPLGILAVVEGVLVFLEPHPGVFVSVQTPDGPLLTREHGYANLLQGSPDRVAFAARKAEGVYRIVVLGESTVAGFPYYPYLSFARVLEELLRRHATRPVEVVNLGRTADYSADVAEVARASLAAAPDLLVVYSGHNEYQIPYCDELRGMGAGLLERWVGKLHVVRRWAATRTSSSLLSRAPRPPEGQRIGTEAFLDATARAAGVERFRANLLAVVEAARERGVAVALATQVANLRSFTPAYSCFAHLRDPGEQARYEEALSDAEALQGSGDVPGAIAACRDLLERDSGVAEVHYLLAQLLEAQQPEDARREYRLALDLDGYPSRAGSAINQVVREIAQAADLPLLDVEQEFLRFATGCVPGADLFLDHCHPRVDAVFLLGLSVFLGLTPHLRQRGVLAEAPGVLPDFRDPGEVDRWLAAMGLDREFLAQRVLPAGRLNLLSYLESPTGGESLVLARACFRTALEVQPDLAEAHLGLAAVAVLSGNRQSAIVESAAGAGPSSEAREAFVSLCRTNPTLRAALERLSLAVRADASLAPVQDTPPEPP